MQDTERAVGFAPRRLAHANIFVGNLERSIEFYNKICGLELVRLEPEIVAGFLTAGTSHHDVGLMEASEDARIGRDGHVQVPPSRGRKPGLNHFGWEMENEKELVAAYHRAKEADVRIYRTTDHLISHSVYIFDPEGNLNEFYADAIDDWRTIFNLDQEDLVTGQWDPDASPPNERPMYAPDPKISRQDQAVFHPYSISFGVLVVKNYERMKDFYCRVAGLEVAVELDGRAVVLAGKTVASDLILVAGDGKLAPGLHHLGFILNEEDDLDSAQKALEEAGVNVVRVSDSDDKKSVIFRDPDGILLEFYRSPAMRSRSWTVAELEDVVAML